LLTPLNTPRDEITLGVSTAWSNWKLHTAIRRDINTNKQITTLAGGSYENECFIFDMTFYRRFTSLSGDHGSTAVLFQITLKTVGEFGFHAF
jgi:LPS-assembly protein